ncbi:hypothetical protein BH11PAT1_BH11PAT1_5010 [soil metagenome]
MAAYNLENEQRLLTQLGNIPFEKKVLYVQDQLRATVAERNNATNHFSLVAEKSQTIADGLSEYGDLTFKKSEDLAPTDRIAMRYALENLGWESARKKFFELPLYSSVLLFSPPPTIKIEGYDGGSMAYFYHILPHEDGDPEKRTIKALTWMHTLDKQEQAHLLNTLERDVAGPIAPSEESVLLHPVWIKGDVDGTRSFRKLWKVVEDMYHNKQRDFLLPDRETAEEQLLHGDKVWRDRYRDLSDMTREIALDIVGGATALELKKKWRIMINKGDEDMKNPYAIYKKDQEFVTTKANNKGTVIFEEYNHLNKEIEMRATPCGLSGEITARDGLSSWTFDVSSAEGSLANPSLTEKTLTCTCPFCNKKVDAIIGGGKITCPKNNGGCGKSAPYNC